uniref:Large ribosomal subunit protein bL32c n=1 Tax=Characiochloris acuminata TaxID=167768 RepID=A0A0S2LPJ1_9CHLO|nr:ribosomal protein L32 [Characiochloris acuminata]ALO63325.1 ribosomal protein L32 [Characiochloris acuminata]
MAVPKKRTSKSKKNIRKSAWKKKVEKQAIRSLFLAKYLLKTKPEDPAVEKLITRLNDTTPSENNQEEKGRM